MKKSIKNIFLILLLLNFASCAKRNFYADVDDPGLSRFTSYGYNVVTEYINGMPYINPFSRTRGNSPPILRKINTNSAFDTLSLSWQIVMNDSTQIPDINFQGITILIPVSKTFDQNDFLALSGQRLDTTTTSMQTGNPFYQPGLFAGTANVYFVKIYAEGEDSLKSYQLSGLFSGNIGDSIFITKGRFDFDVPATNFNF
jgi:hypothetical protein